MLLRPRTWYWVEGEDLGITAYHMSSMGRSAGILKAGWDEQGASSMAAEGIAGFKNKIIIKHAMAEKQSLLGKLGKVSGSVR